MRRQSSRAGNVSNQPTVTDGMTPSKTLPIHGAAVARPRPSLRFLKIALLAFALLAGIGAITITAAASALTEEGGGMAGYG